MRLFENSAYRLPQENLQILLVKHNHHTTPSPIYSIRDMGKISRFNAIAPTCDNPKMSKGIVQIASYLMEIVGL